MTFSHLWSVSLLLSKSQRDAQDSWASSCRTAEGTGCQGNFSFSRDHIKGCKASSHTQCSVRQAFSLWVMRRVIYIKILHPREEEKAKNIAHSGSPEKHLLCRHCQQGLSKSLVTAGHNHLLQVVSATLWGVDFQATATQCLLGYLQ